MMSQFRRGMVPTCRNLALSRATQSTSAAILMPNRTSDSTSDREFWTSNTRRRLHARQRVPPKPERPADVVPTWAEGQAFLAGAFLAVDFLAGAFLAAVFLAGAFLAAVFLAGAFL